MEKNSTAISRIDNILEQMKSPTQYGTELTSSKLDTIATAELGYLLNIMYQQWEIIETASHTSKDSARHNYERAMNIIREILIVIIDEGHKTHSRSAAERGEYYRALAQRASALNNIWHSTINHSTPPTNHPQRILHGGIHGTPQRKQRRQSTQHLARNQRRKHHHPLGGWSA